MAKGRRKGKKNQKLNLRIVAVVLAVLVVASAAIAIKQASTATVWFSSNDTGYLCFLDSTVSGPRGGPLCLTDANNNATVPVGKYTIVFFATHIPQGGTFNGFIGSGGIAVGNWTQYADPFSYQANMIVTGDGTLSVTWTEATPVPEFPAAAPTMVALIALAAFLVTRFKRHASG